MRQGFGLTETTLATFSSETDLPGAVGVVTAHCEAKVCIYVYFLSRATKNDSK